MEREEPFLHFPAVSSAKPQHLHFSTHECGRDRGHSAHLLKGCAAPRLITCKGCAFPVGNKDTKIIPA